MRPAFWHSMPGGRIWVWFQAGEMAINLALGDAQIAGDSADGPAMLIPLLKNPLIAFGGVQLAHKSSPLTI